MTLVLASDWSPGVTHLVQLVGDGGHDAQEAQGAGGGPQQLRVRDGDQLAPAVHILQLYDPVTNEKTL